MPVALAALDGWNDVGDGARRACFSATTQDADPPHSRIWSRLLAVKTAMAEWGTARIPGGHSGGIWGVIAQEGEPSLAWRPASLDHVLGDR